MIRVELVNFQQLRIIRETVRQNFNLTDASDALFTSQSGVSKHIKDLENELGVQLFVRKGKRLLGLTEPGQALLGIVERMLIDADNIKRLANDFNQLDQGTLTIATTHTQARYVLPKVVKAFKTKFPKVELILQQASPADICEMVLQGEADIGIATESLTTHEQLTSVPYYQWQHCVLVPTDHELADQPRINLAQLVDYPIITYHGGFTGRSKIDEAFVAANLVPQIVMSALDADVIKTYVELGLGVGIVNQVAFDAMRDHHLKQIMLDDFGHNTTWIAVRTGHLLRGYGYDFIALCDEQINLDQLKQAAYPA